MSAGLGDLTSTLLLLEQWYSREGRAFFERWDSSRLPLLDRLFAEAKDRLSPDHRELPICFLGNAGVGKSTLINSLVDPRSYVVPQGGIGPLTAQATMVKYAEQPYLHARYYGSQRVNQLAFALDRFCERRQRYISQDDYTGLDAAVRNELQFALAVPTGDDEAPEARQLADARARAYISQARQLITGDQYGEDSDDQIAYLADMLRAAHGRKPQWGHTCRPEHVANLEALRAAIAIGDHGLHLVADDLPRFLGEVRRHATGSIAPLIKHLEVGWHTDVLQNGLLLVDLPGVGVANDEYRSVTSEWIRKASAVVLVVDRSGVTEASAELLRVTGFLNTLLHRAPESTEISPLLWVAAVKLDDVAKDERESFKQQHPGEQLPRWIDFFQQSCTRVSQLIEGQLSQELTKLAASAPEEVRDERNQAQRAVLEQLQVHAISAIQYRKVIAQDEDDRAWVASPEESNLPRLADALRGLAQRHVDQLTIAATGAIASLLASIQRSALSIVEDLEGTSQAKRFEDTRAQLAAFIAPRERELANRLGQLRERLRATIPATIEKDVAHALTVASKGVSDYLATLQGIHWSTLRATIRRGGVRVDRRTIDLPNELALRLEEPVAVIWSRSVVPALKASLGAYAKDVHRILAEVVTWAQSPEIQLDARRVERYRDEIADTLTRLSGLADAGVASLRDQAKQKLHETLEKVIRRQCERFVDSGEDKGAGVSKRVNAFLWDAFGKAMRDVEPAASRFLVERYQRAVSDLSEQFGQTSEALTHAQSLLLGERQLAIAGRVEEAAMVRALIARIPQLAAPEQR